LENFLTSTTKYINFLSVTAQEVILLTGERSCPQDNNNNNNTKFVKRRGTVAPEALANTTVKKHRRRRTNVRENHATVNP